MSLTTPRPIISEPSAPLRRVWHFLPLALVILAGSVLALSPNAVDSSLAVPFALILVFVFPGYLGWKILFANGQPFSVTRLPVFFVFSLALWAMPATALQLAGANWTTFRIVFVVILWLLLVTTFVRVWLSKERADAVSRTEIAVELVLALVCAAVALVVALGGRDADDWLYLQVTQQFIASNPFQIFAASETRYSIRYAFHVWIFLQAYLGEWLHADVVALLRTVLPVLLAPLGLISFYAWGKTFFGNARTALVAVAIQLVVYVTFNASDGWGHGFFERSAQDKFLVWLIVLPVALIFAWNFLRNGKFVDWVAFGATMVAGLWVHPVSLFLVVLTLGGFALFNLISRTPYPRQRWLFLTIASLPALVSPLVIRATTLPSVFTVNTPEVEAYIRLSEGRLVFQPPFYFADPGLVAHPVLLLAFALFVLFATRLRTNVCAQFLWGATLVPLALLFDPFTARILGEMLTPWQLWRMTWGLPIAFIIAQTIWERRTLAFAHWRPWQITATVVLLGLTIFGLSDVNWGRTLLTVRNNQMLEPSARGIMETLRATLRAPVNVLLPRDMTRYAPAYTFNARVMSNDAQKIEDARGKQIDRFYDPKADPKFLEAFLDFWQMDYVVAPRESLAADFVRTRAGSVMLYENDKFVLWKVERSP